MSEFPTSPSVINIFDESSKIDRFLINSSDFTYTLQRLGCRYHAVPAGIFLSAP
jgi:hypothetical protein